MYAKNRIPILVLGTHTQVTLTLIEYNNQLDLINWITNDGGKIRNDQEIFKEKGRGLRHNPFVPHGNWRKP